MNKEIWIRPVALVQQFTANEYVAACGESGTTYKFVCDANKGWGFDLGGIVYRDNNHNGTYEWYADEFYSLFVDCGETHIADSEDEFFDGVFRATTLIPPYYQDIPVIVWKGENGDKCHCTRNLDMDTWETAKS